MLLAKRLLKGMQDIASGNSLDRHDVRAFGLDRKHGAALYGTAIHVDYARAALAGVASHVRAGLRQMLADHFNEQCSRTDIRRHGLAIENERHR